MNYKGVIIQESLADMSVLDDIKILKTQIHPTTEKHRTPWVKQWTLHTIEVPQNKGSKVAERLSKSLDKDHSWYADYKNDSYHFIIFQGKVFKVDLNNPVLYTEAKKYGVSLGIPEYQVDFAPKDKIWNQKN